MKLHVYTNNNILTSYRNKHNYHSILQLYSIYYYINLNSKTYRYFLQDSWCKDHFILFLSLSLGVMTSNIKIKHKCFIIIFIIEIIFLFTFLSFFFFYQISEWFFSFTFLSCSSGNHIQYYKTHFNDWNLCDKKDLE